MCVCIYRYNRRFCRLAGGSGGEAGLAAEEDRLVLASLDEAGECAFSRLRCDSGLLQHPPVSSDPDTEGGFAWPLPTVQLLFEHLRSLLLQSAHGIAVEAALHADTAHDTRRAFAAIVSGGAMASSPHSTPSTSTLTPSFSLLPSTLQQLLTGGGATVGGGAGGGGGGRGEGAEGADGRDDSTTLAAPLAAATLTAAALAPAAAPDLLLHRLLLGCGQRTASRLAAACVARPGGAARLLDLSHSLLLGLPASGLFSTSPHPASWSLDAPREPQALVSNSGELRCGARFEIATRTRSDAEVFTYHPPTCLPAYVLTYLSI